MKLTSILFQLSTLCMLCLSFYKLYIGRIGQAGLYCGISVLLAVIAIMVNDIRRYK